MSYCSYCPYQTANESTMVEHIKSSHGNLMKPSIPFIGNSYRRSEQPEPEQQVKIEVGKVTRRKVKGPDDGFLMAGEQPVVSKPTTDNELEMKLMDLFIATEQFGQHFLTGATKEEFADAVNKGALDHQEAAHRAMQLIQARDKQRDIETRIDEVRTFEELTAYKGIYQSPFLNDYSKGRIAELEALKKEGK